jgi:hypothetical protein
MNASYKKAVPLSLIFMCILSACGESENQPTQQPLVTAEAQSVPLATKIQIDAGGIRGSYIPRFEGDQIVEIGEERAGSGGMVKGRYSFRGARLMRYEGASFEGNAELNAQFTLEGALIEARKGDGPAPEEEITQVRRRAQLLRSHALAQRASKLHTANH